MKHIVAITLTLSSCLMSRTFLGETQRFEPFLVADSDNKHIAKLMSDAEAKEYIIGDVMSKIDDEIKNVEDLLEEINDEDNREEILSDIEYDIRQLDEGLIKDSLKDY